MEGDEYELASGYVMSKCYDDFPILYFMFGNKWVSIEPEEYVIDISDLQDRSICVLLLGEGQQSFFIMGLPLYMNYYTIHDETNSRIGFVPHSTSTKGALQQGEQPNRAFKSLNPEPPADSALSWIITGFLIFFFLCVWLCLISETMANNPNGYQPGALCTLSLCFTAIFALIVVYYL